MAKPPPRKRSLTHVGGAIDIEGNREDAALLAHALEVDPAGDEEEDPARRHIHGFHTYPARMHPVTAGRLVQGFSKPGDTILDPFCGCGTVLVEAMIAGRNALGIDLNPLAVQLSRCKTRMRDESSCGRLLQAAQEIAGFADERRLARAKPFQKYPHADVALFEPHILMELDSLREALKQRPAGPENLDLWMVFSSILGKMSRRQGDTSGKVGVRKLAPGFPARHFVRKTEDLVYRSHELDLLLGQGPRGNVEVTQGNALGATLKKRISPQGVICSPPYAGTYDYHDHHALRLRWLGLPSRNFVQYEMGARKAYSETAPQEARGRWLTELGHWLDSMAKLLTPGSHLVVVMADSAVGKVELRADECLAELAPKHGFLASARASQNRPHFHGPGQIAFRRKPRREHAIALRRS